tara:strand:- start:2231 stop:3190 length:960 start_codon:yes stop_codon:yes gene_type:complete
VVVEAGTSAAVIVLGGPTASGKSGLALRLAQAFDGTLINADSMQVYWDLRILTARPMPDDEAAAPHELYGVMDAADRCSVGLWHQMARQAADEAAGAGRLPILVGGTGFYLHAFLHGMSPIPETPSDIRAAMSERMAACGPAPLHAELRSCDPDLAAQLEPGDSQRIQRALEVFEATGTPLSQWQRKPREGGWEGPVLSFSLVPPREALYRLCDQRFGMMIEAGALDEVRDLMKRSLNRSLPAMRALGVPHLMAHLEGSLSLDDAMERARTGTRRYAKRQLTWFRNQIPDAEQAEGFGFDGAGERILEVAARFLERISA